MSPSPRTARSSSTAPSRRPNKGPAARRQRHIEQFQGLAHGLHRSLHPPPGTGERHQPADRAARHPGLQQPDHPPVPADGKRTDHGDHRLPRRQRRNHSGLYHPSVAAESCQRRRGGLHDLGQPAERLGDLGLRAHRRRHRSPLHRAAQPGQLGQEPAAAGRRGPGAEQAGGRFHCADVHQLLQRPAVQPADHRLPVASHSAQAGDAAGHGRGGDPWQPGSPCACGWTR